MSKKKQTYNPCDDCQYSYSKNGQENEMCKICEFTYFKDRKQSVGKWIKATPYSQEYCNQCGLTPKTIFGKLPPFCPNCGANMKGGAE